MMTDHTVEVCLGKEAAMKSTTINDYVNDAVFPTKKLDEGDKVLEFMRKPVPFCATAGHFEDAITGKPVRTAHGLGIGAVVGNGATATSTMLRSMTWNLTPSLWPMP